MVPETSSTLIRAIAADNQSVRWNEFVARYRPMMMGYLKSKFSNIDYDDIIQDTFVALARVLPNYCYDPGESGHFRNYLAAVLRNKACDAVRAAQKMDELKSKVSADPTFFESNGNVAEDLWRSIYSIALRQVLDDEAILERNRRIFVEVAINGRRAADVAAMFGVERNNVDQIKARLLKALKDRVTEIARLARDGR